MHLGRVAYHTEVSKHFRKPCRPRPTRARRGPQEKAVRVPYVGRDMGSGIVSCCPCRGSQPTSAKAAEPYNSRVSSGGDTEPWAGGHVPADTENGNKPWLGRCFPEPRALLALPLPSHKVENRVLLPRTDCDTPDQMRDQGPGLGNEPWLAGTHKGTSTVALRLGDGVPGTHEPAKVSGWQGALPTVALARRMAQ